MSKTRCKIFFEEKYDGNNPVVEIFGSGLDVKAGFLLLIHQFADAVGMEVNDVLKMLIDHNRTYEKIKKEGKLNETYQA